ncbi:MAG: RodZ domain-containing protein [Dehalobacterium sp.]|jgi:cytoskeleton protein RodZ
MDDIGEILHTTREAKNITLREVENCTKIRMKYLIALEANDFDALPGRAYLFGFLRTYARFLGLNDEELVHSLKNNLPKEVQHEERKRSIRRKKIKVRPKKRKFLAIIGILFAVLIVAKIGMAFWGDRNSDDPNSAINESQTASETTDDLKSPEEQNNQGKLGGVPDASNPEGTSDNNKTDSEADINGVSVTVIIKEDSCWIGVTVDDKKDFQGTLTAGENRTFVGQEKIVIKYGNAGVVEVITNGDRTYPVGSKNQVVTKEYLANNEI